MKCLLGLVFTDAFAFAQDSDIPPRFKNKISPEPYFQLRDAHIDNLRGLPADPSLRATAVQQMQQQKRVPNVPGGSGSGAIVTVPAWKAIGQNPIPNGQVTGGLSVSGRTTAFQIDPTNSNKLYLGTAQGGVYRSLYGGNSWTQIFDGATSSAIGACRNWRV